jgi:OOP family OmpA-OmpF porin
MNVPNVVDEDLNRLIKILAKPTTQRLDQLDHRIDSIEECLKASPTAENVSAVLPEAVRISERKSPDLATTLEPVIELDLDRCTARNRDKMANALYPLLGAMIRKYVDAAVRDAIESINMVLARALSLQGVKWRWESFRTGVPVYRIAFKHCLVFRSEHVFLVHNRTGQPLFHLSAPDAIETDQLAFAGMIGAITDFIKDAFFRKESIGLRSIGVGEFTVWFEEGPLATIAVVIRGEPRPLLRDRLRTISAKLHNKYPSELENAMVDEVSLMSYDSLLRDTLLQEPREAIEKQKRIGRIATSAMAVALVILGAIGLTFFLRAHARDARFDRFISHVKSSEGVLITDYGKNKDGKYFVTGVVPGSASSIVLPVENFGFRRDEVDVKLNNHVFMVGQSNRNEQLQNFRDQLHQLDGIPWPTDGSPTARAWIESTTNRIANAYVLGQALERPFIVVIEHPSNLKAAADKLSGQIAWRLYLQGVYDRGLLRTQAVDKHPGVLRVLQERTIGG